MIQTPLKYQNRKKRQSYKLCDLIKLSEVKKQLSHLFSSFSFYFYIFLMINHEPSVHSPPGNSGISYFCVPTFVGLEAYQETYSSKTVSSFVEDYPLRSQDESRRQLIVRPGRQRSDRTEEPCIRRVGE